MDTYFGGDQHTNDQCSQSSVSKTNDYWNYVEPQEAEGSLRLHNSIIQGNISQIRPHLRNCQSIIQYNYKKSIK